MTFLFAIDTGNLVINKMFCFLEIYSLLCYNKKVGTHLGFSPFSV